ncbi:hypothetical protein GGS21DRAFT_499717 [Xylaria nigripes]|nr:hypothetical protein GGS21DRAFT_499717 [Xylaria nigripes]
MEEKKAELLRFAREYATENKDLYELLSVSTSATQPEIHRAWRKASLKHHPDKAKNFDRDVWELFERARDVLSFSEARATYDDTRAAAVQAQKARAALDAKKREMIDDLEARERGIKRKVGEGGANGRHMMTEAEKRALMETGKEHLEKRRRLREEAEARERERELERERTKTESERDQSAAQTEPERQRRHSDFDHLSTASTSGSTSTDHKLTGDKGVQPSSQHPLPDDYDERIAYLEGRGWEQKARKAAGKVEKEVSRDKDATQKEAERQRKQFDFDRVPAKSTSPSASASASVSASVSTDYRMTENTESKSSSLQPLPDDYDERIAYLEGRIRERKAEKATRKAEKKASKTQVDGAPLAGETPRSTTVPPVSVATKAADSTETVSSPSKPKAAPPAQPSTSRPATVDFSSTMAKLRLAQREKERKKAEETATTTTTTTSSSTTTTSTTTAAAATAGPTTALDGDP